MAITRSNPSGEDDLAIISGIGVHLITALFEAVLGLSSLVDLVARRKSAPNARG